MARRQARCDVVYGADAVKPDTPKPPLANAGLRPWENSRQGGRRWGPEPDRHGLVISLRTAGEHHAVLANSALTCEAERGGLAPLPLTFGAYPDVMGRRSPAAPRIVDCGRFRWGGSADHKAGHEKRSAFPPPHPSLCQPKLTGELITDMVRFVKWKGDKAICK